MQWEEWSGGVEAGEGPAAWFGDEGRKAWTRTIAGAVGDGLKDIYYEKETLTGWFRIKAEV